MARKRTSLFVRIIVDLVVLLIGVAASKPSEIITTSTTTQTITKEALTTTVTSEKPPILTTRTKPAGAF